jgi:hypothetical protein
VMRKDICGCTADVLATARQITMVYDTGSEL